MKYLQFKVLLKAGVKYHKTLNRIESMFSLSIWGLSYFRRSYHLIFLRKLMPHPTPPFAPKIKGVNVPWSTSITCLLYFLFLSFSAVHSVTLGVWFQKLRAKRLVILTSKNALCWLHQNSLQLMSALPSFARISDAHFARSFNLLTSLFHHQG